MNNLGMLSRVDRCFIIAVCRIYTKEGTFSEFLRDIKDPNFFVLKAISLRKIWRPFKCFDNKSIHLNAHRKTQIYY